MDPRFTFVAEPQTNGLTERFYRTRKEQIAHERTHRTLLKVKVAGADFVDRHNRLELVEKLGFGSARQAFEEYQIREAARVLRCVQGAGRGTITSPAQEEIANGGTTRR